MALVATALRLDLRQTQGLVLTPQLQQAIRLLQLSNIELSAAVDREVAENPFLDRVDTARPANGANGAATAAAPLPAAARGAAAATDGDDGWQQPAAGRAADCTLGLRRVTRGGQAGTGEPPPPLEGRLAKPRGLREHLLEQVGAGRRPAEVRALAATLVDWLDQDGYLREDDADLSQRLAVPATLVAQARAALQACDPAGVAARDLAECLALQLRERDRYDPAMRALVENLPLLAKADFAELTRRCGVDAEDLHDMVAELRRLDPRPARTFGADEQPFAVIPDVIVHAAPDGAGWRVELNSGTLPRVLVDRSYYAEVARQGNLDRQAKEYVGERLQAAGWLAKALDQRAKTVLKVASAIFTRQRSFLERGVQALRPLVLRDIAERTGLHESTVSRATAEKYASTPHGTFPLKFFFTASIQAAGGEEAHSAEVIRQQIRRLIEREDPGSVLSDDQIVAELRRKGAVIARRTVAKYREALGIASSVERRRAKALGR
jgi:RNA polymerase sigma-54 factor